MTTVRTLLTVSCIKSHSLPCPVKAIKPELTDSADNIAVASNLGMAEEFQAGICGGKYWWNFNSTKSVFPLTISSPCSMAANDAENYSSWQIDHSLVSDHSLGFLDEQKPQQSGSASTSSQMMGFGVSSSTSSNWNQSLLRLESNFQSVLQEDMDSSNSQIQKDWSPTKSFSTSNIDDAFKPMNPEFCLDQQSLSSYGYNSKMMQSLYDHPHPDPQPQNSLFTNQSMAYSSTSNEVLPTWSIVSPFLKPEQQPSGLHFSNNNTPPFWNNASSTEALDHDTRADVFASPQGQYQAQPLEEEPTCPTLITKPKREEAVDSVQGVKRSVCEPASFKRPRIETPSPLPTFKVRKEKLGDRITALQQLVSPFGKTDTASVLHEAIEYIKYLHDQVSVLSAPYMNNGTPIQHQQGSCDDQNESEGPKQDLRSRGLCLVPISSTFPVANEIAAELWTHTLGGALIG